MMRFDSGDGRDWARKILDKIERKEPVHPIAAEYALEALVGFPRHATPGQATAEVIQLRPALERPQEAAAPAPAPAVATPDDLPAWEGSVDSYWWNDPEE